ncbi:hypothetical protein HPB52_000443 [Rhipicephalus sanguineus]|uniref:Uncharacterized protein n=1 Tax=Rhipicephalus sanguineus TaxID=34632 RepID=A0A9D4PEA3_RHISA|nr:hypothetical protein HPB52_000443 [Rhipicephalus sanguineus]
MSNGEDCGALSSDKGSGQLDLDRPCGQMSSGETCWLCDDITAWNQAMRALGLQLEEPMPGTLLLQCTFDSQMDIDQVTTAREASLLASTLLRQHPCIQDLSVLCPYGTGYRVELVPFPGQMSPPSLMLTGRRFRSLKITQRASAHQYLTDLDTITGLETLHIAVDKIDENFTAKINTIMKRNCSTLKKVQVSNAIRGRSRLRMLENLVACDYLVLRSSDGDGTIPDVDLLVKLMGVSSTLKEVSVQLIHQVDVSIIARALETNRTLTKLSLHARSSGSVEELFGALELNKTLKELSLWIFLDQVNMRFMRAVASAIENNNTLTLLHMNALFGQCQGMKQWSEALTKNCALHVLSLSCWSVPIAEVSTLCKVLRVNKTLKALNLHGVNGTDEERTVLEIKYGECWKPDTLARSLRQSQRLSCESQKLPFPDISGTTAVADECYDRVVLGAWTEPCLRILSPVLASPKSSVETIFTPPIGELSLDIVKVLFNDLASNRCVKSFNVCVEHEPDTRVALVCEALKKNRFIQYLHLTLTNGNSANEILRALTLNTGITELQMSIAVPPTEETMAALSGMFLHNKAMTNISALLVHKDGRQFLDPIAEGISGNRLIIGFKCMAGESMDVPSAVLDSVQRNKSALNRAVQFVLRHREDRRSAECFEFFVGRSCLMTRLKEVAGLSDVEARHEVASAEHRLREMYFVITGVVRRSVVCLPADFTQIDALNADCWRALASHLQINDVCFQ